MLLRLKNLAHHTILFVLTFLVMAVTVYLLGLTGNKRLTSQPPIPGMTALQTDSHYIWKAITR